jgi:hypothetical protein
VEVFKTISDEEKKGSLLTCPNNAEDRMFRAIIKNRFFIDGI